MCINKLTVYTYNVFHFYCLHAQKIECTIPQNKQLFTYAPHAYMYSLKIKKRWVCFVQLHNIKILTYSQTCSFLCSFPAFDFFNNLLELSIQGQWDSFLLLSTTGWIFKNQTLRESDTVRYLPWNFLQICLICTWWMSSTYIRL